jgi:ubiquinone/menaquinone biosynthesis C-methylase UbiE
MLFRRRRTRESQVPSSSGYQIIDRADARSLQLAGWLSPQVAQRQHAAYQELILTARSRRPRRDLELAAQMLQQTDLTNPSLLEVGCGSGYYFEVFSSLLRRPIRYVGIDSSRAMLSLGKETYRSSNFVLGNAAHLPFPQAAFDVVFNGVSLMHTLQYDQAIAESARISRCWCIYHTVPTLRQRQTTFLTKRAYGELVLEVIFNEKELLDLFSQNGMSVVSIEDSIPYDLQHVLEEKTDSRSYLCKMNRK